jgi:hypothetical protein
LALKRKELFLVPNGHSGSYSLLWLSAGETPYYPLKKRAVRGAVRAAEPPVPPDPLSGRYGHPGAIRPEPGLPADSLGTNSGWPFRV